MDRTTAHSARWSLFGSRLAQAARKPVKRLRTRKARRAPSLGARGAIVPMLQMFRRRRTFGGAVSVTVESVASGVREQEWLRSHWREYAGKWVALNGGNLVAAAAGAREVLEKARAAGIRSPFLVHVTEPSELPFGGW